MARLIRWIVRAWPIIIPGIVIALHVILLRYFPHNGEQINKTLALLLQVFGGIFILYSIDSTIGILNGQSLFIILNNWLHSFPLIKRDTVINVDSGSMTMAGGLSKIRVLRSGDTTDEKIERLQQQIQWLKEDFEEESKNSNNRLHETEKRLMNEVHSTNKDLKIFQEKVKTISVGSVGLQIMGVIFIVHGAIAGYLA